VLLERELVGFGEGARAVEAHQQLGCVAPRLGEVLIERDEHELGSRDRPRAVYVAAGHRLPADNAHASVSRQSRFCQRVPHAGSDRAILPWQAEALTEHAARSEWQVLDKRERLVAGDYGHAVLVE
jgi:hypothetical protein